MSNEMPSPADHAKGDQPEEEQGEATTEGVADRRSYSITVLNRAIDILEVFSADRSSLNLRDIVRHTKLPKTTVFRILSSLVERGFCELDQESGKYSLGFVFLKYSDLRRRQTNFHGVAAQTIRAIRELVDETVVLAIRVGDNRVHIDCVETHQQLKRTVSLGVQVPLYIGASGKLLLSGLQDDEISDFLRRINLVAVQDTTITDEAKLWDEIRTIRKLGYAESRGELIRGGGALAAPLRDYTGATVAAVDILTPHERYTEAHREKCISVLLEKTAQASRALGWIES